MLLLSKEIEDKEDHMTRLYKQIDMKSMEVLKYKNAADQAKVSHLCA